jgi:hypothetical protein
MDILDSMRAEFNVLNDKLDFVVIAIKEGGINKNQFDKYISIDAKREDIDYNEDKEV